MQKKPKVHILLASYNGSAYIGQQIESIINQTYNNWTLTISDDGSTDNTVDIITGHIKEYPDTIRLINGPRQGSATKNFFHLINKSQTEDASDLFAFCDQDDVWLDKKLELAVNWHIKNLNQSFRLYCSRTQIVDHNLNTIGFTQKINREPSFENAIVQNIASGNTMIISTAVLEVLKKINPNHSVWQDWTTYLAATAMGGIVKFDKTPTLLYRQHTDNLVGGNDSYFKKINRFINLLTGSYKSYSDLNLLAINDLGDEKTKHAAHTTQIFTDLRKQKSPIKIVYGLLKSDIRRQTLIQNLTLIIGLSLKKY